jgi:hypothetical protein
MTSDVKKNCAVIDDLVEAYNRQDARHFADLFAEDGWHGNLHGVTSQIGREAIYQRYVEVFGLYPSNRTEVVHRIAFDHFVIDHEKGPSQRRRRPFRCGGHLHPGRWTHRAGRAGAHVRHPTPSRAWPRALPQACPQRPTSNA